MWWRSSVRKTLNIIGYICENCDKEIATTGCRRHVDNLCDCGDPKPIRKIKKVKI